MLGNLWQIVFGDIGLKQDFADRHITQKLIHFISAGLFLEHQSHSSPVCVYS